MRSRARLVAGSAAVLLALAGCAGESGGGAGETGSKEPIVIGSILDVTGVQNVSGKAMLNSLNLAVKQWNAKGGLLGRQVQVKFYDSGSDQAKYAQYANQLSLKDKPDVAMAGINSASREAIRPIFGRNKLLYFYNELYEGGVCDKNTFATGLVPSQSLAALIPSVIKQYGKKVYIVAADYNFGQISALWAKQYVGKAGGTVVGEKFIPLASSDFGSVIDDVQQAKPDVVVSFLVGSNHVAFYRAYAAAGLNQNMHIASTVFGLSSEQEVLSPKESTGVTVAYGNLPRLDTPENKSFRDAYEQAYGKAGLAAMTDSAVTMWNGLHLWKAAVEKAGTTERDKVIQALESGISFKSPSGTIAIDPGSHHAIQAVSLGETDGQGGFKVLNTLADVPPSFEMEKCNLVKDPSVNKQFTP